MDPFPGALERETVKSGFEGEVSGGDPGIDSNSEHRGIGENNQLYLPSSHARYARYAPTPPRSGFKHDRGIDAEDFLDGKNGGANANDRSDAENSNGGGGGDED